MKKEYPIISFKNLKKVLVEPLPNIPLIPPELVLLLFIQKATVICLLLDPVVRYLKKYDMINQKRQNLMENNL